MQLKLPSLLIPLFLVLPINHVYASDIEFSNFGSQLGDALGIGDFGGGLLASTIILFAILLFLGVATRKKPTAIEILILTFPIYSLFVYLAWIPVWSFAVLTVMIALFFGDKILKRFR